MHYEKTVTILRFTDMAAMLILPPGHPIMIIEINIFLCEHAINFNVHYGIPWGKINMAAIPAKQSMKGFCQSVCN